MTCPKCLPRIPLRSIERKPLPMTTIHAMPKRSEIPQEETWDLSVLFPSDADFIKARERLIQDVDNFAERYQKALSEAPECALVVSALKAYEDLHVAMQRVGSYGYLRVATDMGDAVAQRMQGETSQVFASLGARLSFFMDALSKLSPSLLSDCRKACPELAVMLGDIQRWQPHQLDPQIEALLARLSPSLRLPYTVYETIKGADMRFPEVKTSQGSHPLSYVLYENQYCGSTDTELRREAFKTFSDYLRQYRHTNAALYNAQVQHEKTMATARGFDSVFDFLLFEQKVDRSLYERQIDVSMTLLAPHMRRWAKLLQNAHQLDEMRYSDLKLVLDPDFTPKLSMADCKAYTEAALAPMGEAYREMIMASFDERWVDFAQNQGKSTGGFCAHIPKAQPYILLSWSNELSELYTLLHELGHAAQGILCEQNNSPLQADFARYDIEAPSTFHEMLLTRSLLKDAKSPRMERYVLSSMVGNTYYHNFVTHLLEAAYQREVYRKVDAGEQLGADDLDQLFRHVLEQFWGDTVVLDEGAELTWMRQPHYYMGLYPYTYSASLVISTAFAKRLDQEGEAIVPEWIRYLSTGGPMPPVEHAKLCGIDISDEKPLRETIAYIGELIDRIAELS